MLTYNMLHGTYLDPLVQTDEPYALMPPARLFTVGTRDFAVAEPAVWNSLPHEHLGSSADPPICGSLPEMMSSATSVRLQIEF